MIRSVGRSFVAAAIAGLVLHGGSASASSSCSAVPGNLVQNCGFETGNLLDWSYSTTFVFWPSDGSGYGGEGYGLSFWGAGATYPLSQTLPTVAGTTYLISFEVNGSYIWLDEVSLSWDGSTVLDQTDLSYGWQQFTLTEVATTDSTELSFGLRDDNSTDFLDDIVVTPMAVPEPSSLAILGSGLFGFHLIRARRRQVSAPRTTARQAG